MAPEPIIIDATGDVLLTLTQPWALFAVWDHRIYDGGISEDETVVAEETDAEVRKSDEEPEIAGDVPRAEPRTGKRRRAQDSPEPVRAKRRQRRPSVSRVDTPPDRTRSLVFRVSSKLLMNASPRFRKEIVGLSESAHGEDGLYHLSTSNWDPEAFGILLNTLHLRHRKVPKELTLEMLAKIAILVDHYKCSEAFDFIAPIWIKYARKHWPLDSIITRDLMLWMMISWVFKLPREFAHTTAKVIRMSKEERARDLGLGIPKPILTAMESRRIQTIARSLDVCRYWMNKFETDWVCEHPSDSHQCGSMLLGALAREMRRLGLRAPEPQAPYEGLSVEGICRKMLDMKSPVWPDGGGGTHPCSFKEEIDPDIERILEETKGLGLGEFVDRGQRAESERSSSVADGA